MLTRILLSKKRNLETRVLYGLIPVTFLFVASSRITAFYKSVVFSSFSPVWLDSNTASVSKLNWVQCTTVFI